MFRCITIFFLLFVVDNSGSMCQEQARLLNAFEGFITPLKDVDFHLGITTTTIEGNYSPEPLSKPGELQSAPQPNPGFDPSCIQDTDKTGKLLENSYQGLKKRIAFAASCMETPDPFFMDLKDECFENKPTGVVPACATANGVAFSGSRYADFLSEFGENGYALSNASPVCLEDWTQYFVSMGAFFRSRSN